MSDIKITQIEIVRETGIDKATISRYLSGTQVPNLKTANYISEKCNIPITIFTDKDVQIDFLGKAFLKKDIRYVKKEVRK